MSKVSKLAPIKVHVDPNQLEGVEFFRDFAGSLRRSASSHGLIRTLTEISDKTKCMTDAIVNAKIFGTDGARIDQAADRQTYYDLWYKVMLKSLDEAVWPVERFRNQIAAVLNGGDPDAQSFDVYGDMASALTAAIGKNLAEELFWVR